MDSLIPAGNSFQMAGAIKTEGPLLNLVVQEGVGLRRRFWLAERRQCDG